jgi:hypothetical protein
VPSGAGGLDTQVGHLKHWSHGRLQWCGRLSRARGKEFSSGGDAMQLGSGHDERLVHSLPRRPNRCCLYLQLFARASCATCGTASSAEAGCASCRRPWLYGLTGALRASRATDALTDRPLCTAALMATFQRGSRPPVLEVEGGHPDRKR